MHRDTDKQNTNLNTQTTSLRKQGWGSGSASKALVVQASRPESHAQTHTKGGTQFSELGRRHT